MNALMHVNKGTGAMNYLRLLKVAILLGIAFYLKELPPIIFLSILTTVVRRS